MSAPSRSPHPLLVVEDDDDIREAFCELLKLRGFAVESAPDGIEALSKLDRIGRPCLVVLDLMMPRMDGMEFWGRMLERGALKDVPVVVVSAALEGNPHLDLGRAVAVLPKPVSIRALLEICEKFCRASAVPNESLPTPGAGRHGDRPKP